ncbi:hypothetical protein BSKO_10279 [Bryopsis sp. KO-2023]|nr:hypothetical protein BSKO_10279 [Bryopsis sp. KO-2023]
MIASMFTTSELFHLFLVSVLMWFLELLWTKSRERRERTGLAKKEKELERRERELAAKEASFQILVELRKTQEEIQSSVKFGFKELEKRCQFIKMDLGDLKEEFRQQGPGTDAERAAWVQETKEYCRRMEEETRGKCEQMWEEAQAAAQEFQNDQDRPESPVYTVSD